MAKELITKTIDGQTYEFQIFGASQSLKILMRLSKILGKPIGLFMGSLKKDDEAQSGSTIKAEILSQAIEALTSNLDQNEVLDLIKILSSDTCLCDGKKIIFDSHYEGRLDHLFKVLKESLEVQFGNFLSVLPIKR